MPVATGTGAILGLHARRCMCQTGVSTKHQLCSRRGYKSVWTSKFPHHQTVAALTRDQISPTNSDARRAPIRQGSERSSSRFKWLKRVVTFQDFAHLHKVSVVMYVLNSLGIAVVDMASIVQGGTLWYPQQWYQFYPLLALTVVANVSGVIMAAKYRRGVVRSIFITTGLGCIATVVFSWWLLEEWFPAGWRGNGFEDLFAVASAMVAVVAIADFDPTEAMASRNGNFSTLPKADTWTTTGSQITNQSANSSWLQRLTYFTPALYGIPFIWDCGKVPLIGGTAWLAQAMAVHPEIPIVVLNLGVLTAVNGAIAVFAVTLRDRGIVNQKTELLIIGGSTLPVFAFGLWCGFQYPQWFPQIIADAVYNPFGLLPIPY